MTKATIWKNYRKVAGAHNYIIGCELDGKVYMINRKQLGQFLSYEQASRNQGKALRLRIKKADKIRLAKKSTCLGSAEQLTKGKYNKGENFERLVYEYFKQAWKKNNIPFTECGDIQVNGTEIQIKFNGATIVNEKTLARQLARV